MQDLLRNRNEGNSRMTAHLAQAKVNEAILEGIITPAMRGWATELCTQNPESFEDFISKSLPVFAHLNQTFSHMNNPPPAFNTPANANSDAVAAVCDQLGLSPDALN